MIIEAKNIHKIYKDTNYTLHVLKGVNLDIRQGEVLSIVGPSGAGKSTLLHILGGLDDPNEGTIFLQGQDVYALNNAKRSRLRNEKVGFVFQFYHLLPEFTALENVLLPALVQKQHVHIKEFKDKGMDLLEQVGLKERAVHKPYQLSGGEQQRVAIARALINEPAVIFCDEPTGNLDSERGREIIDLLMRLNEKNKQTLVIVTHDETIARRSHRTIRMQDGRLI